MERVQSPGTGLELIAVYKLVKAPIQLLLSMVLIYEEHLGRVIAELDHLALWVEHLTFAHHLAVRLGDWLNAEGTPPHINWAIAILAADGGLTLGEGLGLHYRQRWAAWLTVVATGALIPVDVAGLLHRFSLERIGFLILNLAIVGYLARQVLRRHRAA